MDQDLKCNSLPCRKTLVDKAVVTTCSHIFCVDCANELFTQAQLCPACETQLSEPDDIVVSSLHPSNDYKTSVLSGLGPSLILEICGRAMSFWQYQTQQDAAFVQAVLKKMKEQNAELRSRLENLQREAHGEINLMHAKIQALEIELEQERRKVRDFQESARERDKEYHKLKNHYDKIKRKALLAPGAITTEQAFQNADTGVPIGLGAKARNAGGILGHGGAINAVVGGMEAAGVQRTPLRGGGNLANPNNTMHVAPGPISDWQPLSNRHSMDGSFRAPLSVSGGSVSADEVENMLGVPNAGGEQRQNRPFVPRTFGAGTNVQGNGQFGGRLMNPANVQSKNRLSRGFRPAAAIR